MMSKRKVEVPDCGLRHHFFFKGDADCSPMKCAEPEPLSPQDERKLKQNIALMREHIPEAEAFIKELHREGMIPGMRALVSVRRIKR